MEIRLEQILNKIQLSKAININFILWKTSIDDKTIKMLKELKYSVEQEYFDRFYIISW